ncbi:MAG: hypothetical protein GY761_01270, partial [Hyphomicrobiales bacterium]|nr:hypothetical protein [Hyphomicrobiales bacterium]
MADIYIAANFVSVSGLSMWPSDREDSGHLQIVYGNQELEVQSWDAGGYLGGNWVYRNWTHKETTPYIDDNGVITEGRYYKTALVLREGQNADDVWEVLENIHASMETKASFLDYDVVSQNSNSYVNTMLYAVGLDLNISVLKQGDITQLPAFDKNVLLGGDNGPYVTNNRIFGIEVEGSAGKDFIRGGKGVDTFYASDGEDELYGGVGDDILNQFVPGEEKSIADGATDNLYGGEDDDRFYSAFDASYNFFTKTMSGTPDIVHDSDGIGTLVAQLEVDVDEFEYFELKNLTFESSDKLNLEYPNYDPFPPGIMVAEHSEYRSVYAASMPDGSTIFTNSDGQIYFQVAADTALESIGLQFAAFDAGALESSTGDFPGNHVSSTLGLRFAEYMNHIDGTAAGETLTGTGEDDYISALAGNDVVDAGLGNDVVLGGEGNDEISGGEGYDDLQGGSGTDTLNGEAGDDLITGGAGDDIISGGSGDDQIYGEENDDQINAGAGDDLVATGDGNDSADGGEGTDTLKLNDVHSNYAIERGTDPKYLIITRLDNGSVIEVNTVTGFEKFKFEIEYDDNFNRLQNEFTIDELVAGFDSAPIVENSLIDQSSDEDASLSFVLPADTFSDPEGDELTLSATLADGSQLPDWLSFDAVSRTFSGTPPQDYNGDLEVSVGAHDGLVQTNETFILSIVPVNDAPVAYTPLEDVTIEAGQSTTIWHADDAFIDIDEDILTFAATLADGSELPQWLSIDPATGYLLGTPPAGTDQIYSITITASDGTEEASSSFDLTVNSGNQAPVVDNPMADQSSAEDVAISFTLPEDTFSDPDSDALTLSATLADSTPLPAWLSFDADTRTFSGTPPQDFNGILEFEVSATDGALSASDNFQLTINAVNDAPVIVNAMGDQSFDEDSPVNFAVPADTFSDVEGDALVLSASMGDGSELPSWLAFDGSGFTGTPPANFHG